MPITNQETIMKEEQPVLVCTPKADDPRPRPLIRRTDHCSECQAEVWVAASSDAVFARFPDVIVVCTYCAAELMDENESVVMEPLPEQRRELIEAGVDYSVVERLVKYLNDEDGVA